MNRYEYKNLILTALILIMGTGVNLAQTKDDQQIEPGIYRIKGSDGLIHDLVITDGYLVENKYRLDPAEFVATKGGSYKIKEGAIIWDLEFNSNYSNDGVTNRAIPFDWNGKALTLKGDHTKVFKPLKNDSQKLDGVWHFATRGPDEGQDRRSPNQPRRTLKILQDGHFQWIAFNSETYEFFGTGGGTYRLDSGNYMEHIRFFSRDSDRVGDRLDFQYEISGNDWHHRGKNSRGEPMYEIWSRS